MWSVSCRSGPATTTAWPPGSGVALSHAADLPPSLLSDPYTGLKKCIAQFMNAEVRKVDIWDVEIHTSEVAGVEQAGCIRKVVTDKNGKKQKEPMVTLRRSTGEEVRSRVFRRKMSNYCSIGIDARIGLGFDKNRSKTRWVNKLVYAWEGLKKFLKPSINVGSIIEKMETIVAFDKVAEEKGDRPEPGPVSDPSDPGLVEPEDTSASKLRPQASRQQRMAEAACRDPTVDQQVVNGYTLYTKQVFQTSQPRGGQAKRRRDSAGLLLSINPINLIALNIPSYMGGITHMWDKSGTTAPIKTADSKIKYEKKQDMGDGEIEFLSFTGNIRFGVLERLLTGGGKRVAQGRRG